MSELLKDLAELVRLREVCKNEIADLRYGGSHDAYDFLEGCVQLVNDHHSTIQKNVEDSKRLRALEKALGDAGSPESYWLDYGPIKETKEWLTKRAAEILREDKPHDQD